MTFLIKILKELMNCFNYFLAFPKYFKIKVNFKHNIIECFNFKHKNSKSILIFLIVFSFSFENRIIFIQQNKNSSLLNLDYIHLKHDSFFSLIKNLKTMSV